MNDEMAAVEEVFRQVRPIILRRDSAITHTIKADGTPVTSLDVAIEAIITSKLAEQFPNLPVYGEESGYDERLPARCWLVDPIDGTESFLANVPAFTNMAVLIEAGAATACVIYNPSTDEMFTAQLGGGAYKNSTRLDLSQVALPNLAYCKRQFVPQLEAILSPLGVKCEKGAQGAGHGFAAVAEGQIAARFNIKAGGYVHDYAPGALLVREAGGIVLPITDDEYTYRTRSFVACHPALEATLRSQLAQLRQLESS